MGAALRSGWNRGSVIAAGVIALAGCRPSVPPALAAHHRSLRPLRSLAGVTVVLDPGHGGSDTGAICGGVVEATINYRMAGDLAALLRDRGAHVVYTVSSRSLLADPVAGQPDPPLVRPTDARLVWNDQPVLFREDSSPDDLYRRSAMIRRVAPGRSSRRVIFLAMHCDEIGSAPGRGARVYTDRRAGPPCRLALILKRRLTDAGLTNSRGGRVIPRQYGVLNPHYNPAPESALVEMATLTDPGDRRAVEDPAWRLRVAGVLADAIVETAGSGAARTVARR